MLGPMGVRHGGTSCVLLPALCKYNATKLANIDRQRSVTQVLRNIPIVRELAHMKGLYGDSAELCHVSDVAIRALDMQRSLEEVGIGRDRFDELAGNSLLDPLLAYKPVPITNKERALEILEFCAWRELKFGWR